MKTILFSLLFLFRFSEGNAKPTDIEFKYKYLVPFLTNDQKLSSYVNLDTPISYTTLEIVCGPDSSTVGIGCRAYPGKGKSLELAPFEHVRVPLHEVFDAVMDTVYEVITDKIVLISSTAPLSIFALYCTGHAQYDAYSAFDRSNSGEDFHIVSYYSDTENYKGIGSRFSVSAFEEQTEVEIILAGPTLTGRDSGEVLNYILGQGQTVQIVGTRDPSRDLTGTHISASKPISVHSSHHSSKVPVNINPGGLSWRMPLDETLPSIDRWGTRHYVCSDTLTRNGYLVRVVASEDNTMLTVNGQQWGVSMRAGEHRDTLVWREDFEDPLAKLRWPIIVESTKPVLVANLNHSGVDSDDSGYHNAYLAIVPSMEQSSNDLQFVAMKSDDDFYKYMDHYVTIITDDAAKSTMRLDGELIDQQHFRKLPDASNGRSYSIALLEVNQGAHRVTTEASAEHGFILMVAGRGNYPFSYGYGVGAYSKTQKSAVLESSQLLGLGIKSINPNPTNGKITVDYDSKLSGVVSLSVYSVGGVLVHEEVLAADRAVQRVQVSTEGWASGAYTIVLKSGESEAKASVIKN